MALKKTRVPVISEAILRARLLISVIRYVHLFCPLAYERPVEPTMKCQHALYILSETQLYIGSKMARRG